MKKVLLLALGIQKGDLVTMLVIENIFLFLVIM